ncbi:hypothetical protein [Microlunatus soli]|uniref:Uncharacterized protein n=1 Tax=Microlunatus soli TaxID=630515 RepID=A0A1H1XGT1_9ACTN|nr:hypothetical protein [Microlunatus soli]SDT08463.1 hypothetical protein SAMN04489812_4078 [Microlunatus soli]
MLERLMRFREPAAYLLLAAVGLQIVLALVAVGYYTVMAGPSGPGYIAAQQLSRTLVLLAAIVVVGCALWGPPTPHARGIALAGIVLFGAHGGLALVLAVVGMFGSGNVFAMVTVLLELLVPGLAVVVLTRIRAGSPTMRPPQQPHVPQPPFAGQFPSGPAPNIRPGVSSDRPSFRSQADQFGQPHSNSAGRYKAHWGPQPQSRPPTSGESDQWQPVDQPGPRRLEPSPDRAPVGPHNRPDGPRSGDPYPENQNRQG